MLDISANNSRFSAFSLSDILNCDLKLHFNGSLLLMINDRKYKQTSAAKTRHSASPQNKCMRHVLFRE